MYEVVFYKPISNQNKIICYIQNLAQKSCFL